MIITKTIQNLLDNIEIKEKRPWKGSFVPSNESIDENVKDLELERCVLCNEIVPIELEIDAIGSSKRIPSIDDWHLNFEMYGKDVFHYHQEANNIHPKCKKLREKFYDWGLTMKSVSEVNNFIVNEDNKHAYDMICKWIANPNSHGLYLYGPWGTGKTLLGTKVIVEGSGDEKLLIRESDIYKKLTPQVDNFHRQGEIEVEMEGLQHGYLLVIDDLGGSKYSDWKTEKLFEILSERIDCGLPTFFTSNYNPIQLRERMDGKIVSRVFGLADPCEIGGQDHRLDRR